ncbi:PREDICTED: uncharacterized protein LOC104823514 [Tarenaya hassleriana]|uniref:uncharacterized protein LOC104823514 n=1 Tax=Tarenaya hassleriana TaxID=28532 RepID=UPI00053C180D|nr:PREDICTED: uncharacterized protein LOC104823514 [Tarenaya hassleriana]
MARTNNNKYTSINFNHILHKDHIPSSSSSSSSAASAGSYSAVARSHGRMLVLSRPSQKPLTTKPLISPTSAAGTAATTPPISPIPSLTPRTLDQAPSDRDPDQISLRPLGRTGSGPASVPSISSPVSNPEVGSPVNPVESSRPDRFVPPHLRPGFVGREATPGPDAFRIKDPGRRSPHQQHHHHQPQQQQRQGYFGSPGRYGQNGRPKSGGYERIRTDPDNLGRPRSSGSRLGST